MSKRIAIWGSPGSGKTSLSILIGNKYFLPVYHSDEIFRGKLAEEANPKILKRDILPVLSKRGWIIDGYFGELRKEVAMRATHIIIFNRPISQLFRRILVRSYGSRKQESENWIVLVFQLMKITIRYKVSTFRWLNNIATNYLSEEKVIIVT